MYLVQRDPVVLLGFLNVSMTRLAPCPTSPPNSPIGLRWSCRFRNQYKAALLPIISYRSRLKILVRWIRVLKSQWNSQGCLIT
ncbi:uncharacterized protein PGTG_22807 [Puccinia graminis f. sp. tritici CRL 75-36-700-3]|uniref:Uncharacterized protein n=1 Tax=Puccinia graminis f. sp. tritici (strain CRL 75-36-700-3 / race SCCL) TaxID=418459 RepID=H6QVN6_PUCGT|nr:uncharacterized protein PGTG_22807 [Puccinia graminis f. sp. tritici CRL 75-36-700-3]EHS63551.1 hypothetical protein PGTG_22807 [Puccinia graminis f. sp. tritici CRL 75-36-700-3]